jgi:hypothetical protein
VISQLVRLSYYLGPPSPPPSPSPSAPLSGAARPGQLGRRGPAFQARPPASLRARSRSCEIRLKVVISQLMRLQNLCRTPVARRSVAAMESEHEGTFVCLSPPLLAPRLSLSRLKRPVASFQQQTDGTENSTSEQIRPPANGTFVCLSPPLTPRLFSRLEQSEQKRSNRAKRNDRQTNTPIPGMPRTPGSLL